MIRGIAEITCDRFSEKGQIKVAIRVPRDISLKIRVNGEDIITTPCTPMNLSIISLSVFLYTEGMISELKDIIEMKVSEEEGLADVKLKSERESRKLGEVKSALTVSAAEILSLIKQDVLELKRAFGDPRRTRITDVTTSAALQITDLVPDEEAVVLLTRKGYVRRLPVTALHGRRGGIAGMSSREKDVVAALFVANTQDTAMFFTNRGRMASLPVHQLPDASQQERGLPLANE